MRVSFVFLTSLIGMIGYCQTAQPVEQKIGWVDSDYIFSQLPEHKSIDSELKNYSQQLQNELKVLYDDFQKKLDAYKNLPTTTVDAVRTGKEKELLALQETIQQSQQDAQASLSKRQTNLLAPVYKKIGKAIEAVAQVLGYSQILNTQVNQEDVLLYSSPQFDISELVLKKLDLSAKDIHSASYTTSQKIRWVNVNDLLNQMPEVKKIQADLKTHKGILENQLKRKIDDYQGKLNAYQALPANTLDAVRSDKEKELIALQENIQKFQQDAETSNQKKQTDLMEPIFLKVGKAIEELAKENNYSLVISASFNNGEDILTYRSPKHDISHVILKKFGVSTQVASETGSLPDKVGEADANWILSQLPGYQINLDSVSLSSLNNKIQLTTEQVAVESGYSLIVKSETANGESIVVYSNPIFDISDLVVRKASHTGKVNAIDQPKAPANLEIKSITFSDQKGNGNNMLDGNENGEISFTLINSGKGDAFNVKAEIKQVSSINGFEYTTQNKIGTITSGSNRVVSIPISASMNVESGVAEFEISLKEGNGFDADPLRISFNTLKFKNPQLAIADHKFTTDGGGKVKLNSPVTLQIVLQNRGQGDASNIKVTFSNPLNVFPGSEANFTIDKLKPNETKSYNYEFFANKMYTSREIPVEVIITESYSKYGIRQTFKVSLEQTVPKTQTVVVAGQEDKLVQIDDVSLRPDASNTAVAPTNENTISGTPAYYTLFIGVDAYQFASASLPNLNKPVSDATSLRNALLSNYAFAEGNSIMLSNPKQADIIKVLEDLAKKVTAKDNLLIFYAGHGVWDARLKVGYWLPADSKPDDKSSWISNSTIRDYIAGIQSKHTLLITDACFGGSIFKTREVTPEINEYGVAKIYRLPSRKAMTSGTLTTVLDESKFMEYLLKRLTENTSKYLTARQLFYSLETAVLNNTNTVPQFGVIQDTGDEGGDFIFIRK